MELHEAIRRVQPLCEDSMQAARHRFTNIAIRWAVWEVADAIIQLAGIQRRAKRRSVAGQLLCSVPIMALWRRV